MSSQNIPVNTGQQMTINTDRSQIFLWDNRTEKALYNNSAYGSVTLALGTVMGRVSGTGYIKPLVSSASDGSQFPVGVLSDDFIVEGGDLLELPIVVSGDVAAEKLVFVTASDNLDVTVSSRRLRDRMGSDTVGIKLVSTYEMTDYDNQ